jgi:ABC-type bacteriocin/lantibiotic exporter with double-glycine peptidase domain
MRVCMLSEVGRQTTVDGGQGAARRQSVAPPQSSAQRDELSAALAACRGAFFSIGLFSGVINLLMLTGSFYMLEVYDRVLPSRSLPTLAGLTILAAGLFAFLGLLDLIRGRVLARIATSIDHALTGPVYDSFVRLPLKLGNRDEGVQPLRDLDRVRSSYRARARWRCSICPGSRSISWSASPFMSGSASRRSPARSF